jgi:hypothetical protein
MVAPLATPLRLTTSSPPLLRVRIPYPILTTPSPLSSALRSNLPASLVEKLNSWRQALARRPDPARRKPPYRGGEGRGREAEAAATQRVRPRELAKRPRAQRNTKPRRRPGLFTCDNAAPAPQVRRRRRHRPPPPPPLRGSPLPRCAKTGSGDPAWRIRHRSLAGDVRRPSSMPEVGSDQATTPTCSRFEPVFSHSLMTSPRSLIFGRRGMYGEEPCDAHTR